nr:MAG TPA: hypothetical protein [Caudoviricetes sp.]
MTIYAHDVQMRPKDFEVSLSVDGIRLLWHLTLRNIRTGEIQRVSISSEDPRAAFFVALWEQAVATTEDKYAYSHEEEKKLLARHAEKLRERDVWIDELERRLKKFESESNKLKQEEEYAYVEGWDEF